MTYPVIVNYGGVTYLGNFDRSKKVISNAFETDGDVSGGTIRTYLDRNYIGRNVEVEIGGDEFSTKSLTKENKIVFDMYSTVITRAEELAVKRLVVQEANNLADAMK